MNGEFIIIVFLILQIYIFYKCYKRNKYCKTSLGLLALGMYLISTFFSLIYYCNPLYIEYNELSISPYIYWIISFLIICYPLFVFDKMDINIISYNISFFNAIGIFALVISIEPFIEILPHISELFSVPDASDLVRELHDADERGIRLSSIGGKCVHMLVYIYDLMFIAIYPLIKSPKRNRFALYGVFLLIIVRNLIALLAASRSFLLSTILRFVILLLIFYPHLSLREKKVIKKVSLYLGTFFFCIFVFLTIMRQQSHQSSIDDFTLLYFVSRYAGEGTLNFSQNIPHIKNYIGGDYCFAAEKAIMGMDTHELSRNYLSGTLTNRTGITQNIFYTFIGFFVMDIGLLGSFSFFLFISIIMIILIRRSNQRISIGIMFLLFIYASIIVDGTCIYRYCGGNSLFLLVDIVLAIFIVLNENSLSKAPQS